MTDLPIPETSQEPTAAPALAVGIRRKAGRPATPDTVRQRVYHSVADATGTDRLLTSAQVAARLGISRQMANRLMRTTGFSGVVHVGEVVLVKASVLEEWLLSLG